MVKTSFVGLALLWVQSAVAGYYSVSVTAAPSVSLSPGMPPSPTCGNGTCSVSVGGQNGSASISGSVSTTFTWVRSGAFDEAPETVVIVENCTVDAFANAYPGSPSTSAANGLGHAATGGNTPIMNWIPVPPPNGSYVQIGTASARTSTGTYAWVRSGGDSFTIARSPSGSASSTNGPFGVSLGYSISVHAVVIGVGGAVMDEGRPNALVGQRLSFSLSAGPAALSNHAWTPDGSYFRELVYGAFGTNPMGDPYAESRERVMPTPAQLAEPSISLVWDEDFRDFPAYVEVSATATYNGQSIGTVTARRNLAIWVMHYVYQLSFGHTEYDQSRYTIWTTGSPTGNAGFYCEAWVRSGEKFAHQGLGWFSFAQLLTQDRTQWNAAGVPLHADCPPGSLDNSWPYATIGGAAQWWPADDTENRKGTIGDTNDSPD